LITNDMTFFHFYPVSNIPAVARLLLNISRISRTYFSFGRSIFKNHANRDEQTPNLSPDCELNFK